MDSIRRLNEAEKDYHYLMTRRRTYLTNEEREFTKKFEERVKERRREE